MIELWLPPKPAIIRPASDELRRDWRRAKQANFLPGWFPGAVAGPSGPDLSVVSTGADGTNTATYTFTSVPFGAAASDRLLILAVGGGSASGGTSTLTSVTIGGVSATIHAQAHNTGNTRNGHAAVASASVPTGTSGAVVVTWNTVVTAMLDMSYALYRVTGLQSTTPTDTATATGGSPTMSIDRANLGFIIAAASAEGASSVTWPSPMVNDINDNSDGTFESMSHTPVTAGAVTNFNAGPSTPSGGSPSRYAAASWA